MEDQAGPSCAKRCCLIYEDAPGVCYGFPVKKRPGTDNQGLEYEKYVLLWVLLNLLEDDDVQEFFISDNVDDVGAFDDLIIRVKRNVPGEDRTVRELICLQLKHKENIEKKILWQEVAGKRKNAYQLQKYYEEYKKRMLGSIGKFNDVVLDECLEEEITLVIYTNASFQFEEDIYNKNIFCRKLLESGDHSIVFHFKDKMKDTLWTELQEQKSTLCSEKDQVQNFLNKLILFSQQNNNKMFKEKLINKLRYYFFGENVSLDYALQRALEFITDKNLMWFSRHSGALFHVIFKYQGVLVKLTDIADLWNLSSVNNVDWRNKKLLFMNKIIVQHMCLDKTIEHVSVGKSLEAPQWYYIPRKPNENNRSIKVDKDIMEFLFPEESIVLLCAGPGMGKSSYFTWQANLLKNIHPEKYVIRKDLVDFSEFLHDLNVNEDSKSAAIEFLLEISGITPGTSEHDLFDLSLHKNKALELFLDGVDEISPHYYDKLLGIIRSIRKEFDVQMWISTRPIVQERMERDLGIQSWTLEEFSEGEVIQFMGTYCGPSAVDIFVDLELVIKRVPIFCKMLGDVFINNNKKKLKDITNKGELYDKFVDTMYEVYNKEKKKHDVSIIATKRDLEKLKKIAMEDHEKAALLEVFREEEFSELNWDIRNDCKEFLEDISKGEEKAGLIVNLVNGNPRFIHRTIAEYFCGLWFSKNRDKYEEYVSKYKLPLEVDFHMTYKFKDLHQFLKLLLFQGKFQEIQRYLETCNTKLYIVDSIGRHVLYYVDRFALPNEFLNEVGYLYYIIGKLDLTEDVVQKIDSFDEKTQRIVCFHLMSSFLNNLDLQNHPEYRSLVGFILSYLVVDYFDKHFSVVPYFWLNYCKNLPLHEAILNSSSSKSAGVNYLIEQHKNSKNILGLTPLHLAAIVGEVTILKMLCERRVEYCRDNLLGVFPHQLTNKSGEYGYMILKQFYSHCMEEDIIKAHIMSEDYVAQDLPLHDAVQKKDLDRIKKIFTGFNRIDYRGRTALHVAAAADLLDSQMLDYLFSKGIVYSMDANGFYPHDYCYSLNVENQFTRYGLSACVAILPENKQKICGKHIVDIFNRIKCYEKF